MSWSDDSKDRRIGELFDSGSLTADEARCQSELNAACRYALKDFVGREMTPTLLAEAEGRLKQAFTEMILSGVYVPRVGLTLDRVELGDDMRIKLYFMRTPGN